MNDFLNHAPIKFITGLHKKTIKNCVNFGVTLFRKLIKFLSILDKETISLAINFLACFHQWHGVFL